MYLRSGNYSYHPFRLTANSLPPSGWFNNRYTLHIHFMFKSIMTAAAAATVAFVGFGDAANAATDCTTLHNGYTLCTIDRGHSGSDAIGVFNRQSQMVANMSVVCTGGGGNRWNAKRDTRVVSYNDLSIIANWWCANY